MVVRRFRLIVASLVIALTAAVEKPAAAAAPSADSPQALWADNSATGTAANTTATLSTAADSTQALWANFSQPSNATNPINPQPGVSPPQTLWGDDPAATENPPSVSAPPSQTPSQAFWSSVDRGYKAITPWHYKEYPGFPGWGPAVPFQPTESAFYTRVDFYHWTERYQGVNLLDERGPLYTVGYTLTGGEQRLRLEFFAGNVQYQGAAQLSNGTSIPLDNRTSLVGGRIEYDLFFNCPNHPNGLIFLGLGTRVWTRNLPSANDNGTFVQGYRETWVTLYPYLGVETRHDPSRPVEFYGRMRVGVTAYNYNYAGAPLSNPTNPRAGATALLEEGVRYHDFTISGWTEVFGFSQSHVHNGYLQPTSTLLTVGLKAGYSF